MTWLYIIGYLLIGVVVVIFDVSYDPIGYYGDSAYGTASFAVLAWPFVVLGHIGNQFGKVIVRMGEALREKRREKRK